MINNNNNNNNFIYEILLSFIIFGFSLYTKDKSLENNYNIILDFDKGYKILKNNEIIFVTNKPKNYMFSLLLNKFYMKKSDNIFLDCFSKILSKNINEL